jgi:hypothetical protein
MDRTGPHLDGFPARVLARFANGVPELVAAMLAWGEFDEWLAETPQLFRHLLGTVFFKPVVTLFDRSFCRYQRNHFVDVTNMLPAPLPGEQPRVLDVLSRRAVDPRAEVVLASGHRAARAGADEWGLGRLADAGFDHGFPITVRALTTATPGLRLLIRSADHFSRSLPDGIQHAEGLVTWYEYSIVGMSLATLRSFLRFMLARAGTTRSCLSTISCRRTSDTPPGSV